MDGASSKEMRNALKIFIENIMVTLGSETMSDVSR
jgi:hypothetical protein